MSNDESQGKPKTFLDAIPTEDEGDALFDELFGALEGDGSDDDGFDDLEEDRPTAESLEPATPIERPPPPPRPDLSAENRPATPEPPPRPAAPAPPPRPPGPPPMPPRPGPPPRGAGLPRPGGSPASGLPRS
ncbi:MAG: hypothetical protein AAGA56_26070, partial [Myxococcota bacterium]